MPKDLAQDLPNVLPSMRRSKEQQRMLFAAQ